VDCELEHYWNVRKSSEVLEDYAPPEYQSGR
jgi:hypothetical protein